MSTPASTSGARLRVKIFGERNAGTNYLEQLVARNYDVHMLRGTRTLTANQLRLKILLRGEPKYLYTEYLIDRNIAAIAGTELGWKHAAPDVPAILRTGDLSQHRFFYLLKNPYAFIGSLYRSPYHAAHGASTLTRFVDTEWRLVERDNLPAWRLASPVQLWNKKVASYLKALEEVPNGRLVRYEDIVAHLNSFFDQTDEFLGAQGRRLNIERGAKASTTADFQTYAAKYTNYDPLVQLGGDAVARINAYLDKDLIARTGYAFCNA